MILFHFKYVNNIKKRILKCHKSEFSVGIQSRSLFMEVDSQISVLSRSLFVEVDGQILYCQGLCVDGKISVLSRSLFMKVDGQISVFLKVIVYRFLYRQGNCLWRLMVRFLFPQGHYGYLNCQVIMWMVRFLYRKVIVYRCRWLDFCTFKVIVCGV